MADMNLPPFLMKLYEMTNEVRGQEECFTWSEDGASFWVSNSEQFARDVLPQYFKHNNYASFVRQLNLYGEFSCSPPNA
jgi:heat shock transcription factor, other eukaryote